MSKTFFGLTLFYLAATLYVATTTPISPHEAYTFYNKDTLDSFLMHLGYRDSDLFFSFRIVFYIFGVVNIFLYYYLSQFYFKTLEDRYISTTIFMLLPGVIASMVLVNISVIVISLVLLFLVAYHKKWLALEMFSMIVLLFVHDSAVIFFISIALYSYLSKEKERFLIALAFIIVSLYIGNFEIGGRPRGHFLEIFGIYAAIFSPFVFVYFCYSLYRLYYEKKHDITWYIATIGLLFSLILSTRQRVTVTEFAPYILIGVLFIFKVYSQSLRIRLKIYQKRYRNIFVFIVVTLMLGSITTILHKPLFIFFDDKSKHFAYNIYQPYWLAQELKSQNVECYDTKIVKQKAQLKFYGIDQCQNSQ
ncbi:MAG: hypothetical protein U9N49_05630 [Campylobacterota bacterium]|nr:hypothetical protein [Campylobacterota bacterium]